MHAGLWQMLFRNEANTFWQCDLKESPVMASECWFYSPMSQHYINILTPFNLLVCPPVCVCVSLCLCVCVSIYLYETRNGMAPSFLTRPSTDFSEVDPCIAFAWVSFQWGSSSGAAKHVGHIEQPPAQFYTSPKSIKHEQDGPQVHWLTSG